MSAGISATTALLAGTTIIGGMMASNAAENAANTQANAATAAAQAQLQATRESNAMQQGFFDINQANQQPYMQAGQGAISQLGNLMGTSGNVGAEGYGSLQHQFNASDLNANMAPNYQFMLNQGLQGLQASAAARGGLLTGQGAKDIANYTTNAAQSGYQQAYQNYVTNQTNQYNRLSEIAGLGQNAAAGVGNAGVQTGAGIAGTTMAGTSAANNYLTSGAAAQAAGQIGSSNAWTGALSSGINQYTTLQGLNGANQQGGYSPSTLAAFGPTNNTTSLLGSSY